MPRCAPRNLPSYGDLTAGRRAEGGDLASQLDGDIARMLGGVAAKADCSIRIGGQTTLLQRKAKPSTIGAGR